MANKRLDTWNNTESSLLHLINSINSWRACRIHAFKRHIGVCIFHKWKWNHVYHSFQCKSSNFPTALLPLIELEHTKCVAQPLSWFKGVLMNRNNYKSSYTREHQKIIPRFDSIPNLYSSYVLYVVATWYKDVAVVIQLVGINFIFFIPILYWWYG